MAGDPSAAARRAGTPVESWLEAIAGDWRQAELAASDVALLELAERLTREPGRVGRDDVESLRAAGFDDTAIHDVVQVVALFNYYNRLADGLGADSEPEW